MRELENRNKRRNNVLLYNILKDESEDVDQRQQGNLSLCKDLSLNNLEVRDMHMQKVIRLGRSRIDGRHRPVLVLGSETKNMRF